MSAVVEGVDQLIEQYHLATDEFLKGETPSLLRGYSLTRKT